MDCLWTIREAAAIADLPARTIRSAIDRDYFRSATHRGGQRRSGHLLCLRDLVYLKLLAEFPFILSKADKAAFEMLVRGRRSSVGRWRLAGRDLMLATESMNVHIDYGRLRENLARNAAAFHWGQRRIISDRTILEGEPVFQGTRVTLQEVAALSRKGACAAELAEAFPELSELDHEFAQIYARLGKRPGRPRKSLHLRRTERAA